MCVSLAALHEAFDGAPIERIVARALRDYIKITLEHGFPPISKGSTGSSSELTSARSSINSMRN